jgi:nitroreductase
MNRLDQQALDRLFLQTRTANAFLDKPVPQALLREVYDLAKMGPTSMNTQPARFVFLVTPQEKDRLLGALAPLNVEKTRRAPVTVIVAADSRFFEHLPQVWHRPGAQEMFAGNPALASDTAIRNSSLGGAYFMMAARSVGLDCGPMSGFDPGKVNAEFFADGRCQVNFICNLGYGDFSQAQQPRNPRLLFEQACTVL